MVPTPSATTAKLIEEWVPTASCQYQGLVHRIVTYLRGRTQPQPRLLKQVETLRLGAKSAVYLVECDGARFLIAGGGDNLSAPVPLTQHFAMRDTAADKEPSR